MKKAVDDDKISNGLSSSVRFGRWNISRGFDWQRTVDLIEP